MSCDEPLGPLSEPSGATHGPMPARAGCISPRSIKRRTRGLAERLMSYSLPRQSIARATRNARIGPPPRGRTATDNRSPTCVIASMRPANGRTSPVAIHAEIRSATSGAMRWRWIFQYGSTCERNRRCSAVESACHSAFVDPRILSTAGRQSPQVRDHSRAAARVARNDS